MNSFHSVHVVSRCRFIGGARDLPGLRESEREEEEEFKSPCEKLTEIYKSERAPSHIETDGTLPKILLELARPSGREATKRTGTN